MNESLFYLVMGISIVMSALFIIWHNNQKPLFSLMMKVFASLAFVGLGLFAILFSQNFTLANLFLILGLVASLVGDGVLALLEFKMEGQKEKIIIYGMISFSIAQIFYFVAQTLIGSGYYFWISLIGALVVALAIVFGEKMLKLQYGKTKPFVGIYSFVLALNLIQSLLLAIKFSFDDFSFMFFLGMLCFFVSDLILSFIYFSGKDMQKMYYLNYGFYFVAQNILACSIFYLI